jgi:hypothetical protein
LWIRIGQGSRSAAVHGGNKTQLVAVKEVAPTLCRWLACLGNHYRRSDTGLTKTSRHFMRNVLFGTLLLAAANAASAQFATTPIPAATAVSAVSNAGTPKEYRRDGARHIYSKYASHIYKGKMQPLLYGIAIIETEIDERGNIVNISMVRKPAAPEVGPWAMEMIRQAGPFPPPAKMGHVKYLDIWLVDKSGKFQLDTLTEGQK